MKRRFAAAGILFALLSTALPAQSKPVPSKPTLPKRTHPTLTDATIIAIFDAANTRDMETGQLAAERGASQEVRDFGAMIARDHQTVRQQGRDLAAKLAVTPTPPAFDELQREHTLVMSSLRRLKGAEFDRAFATHERDYHNRVIDLIHESLLPAIRSPELKALVLKVAPAFEGHLHGAEALLARLPAGK